MCLKFYIYICIYIYMQLECILDINTAHVYLCICDVFYLQVDKADYDIGKIFHHENKE